MIIGIIVAVLFCLSILMYYFFYKQYRSGQDKCSMLYPGNSLKMLRLREQCKDNKRRIWAMPVAASMI